MSISFMKSVVTRSSNSPAYPVFRLICSAFTGLAVDSMPATLWSRLASNGLLDAMLWFMTRSWLLPRIAELREECSTADTSVWFLPEPNRAEPTGTTSSLTFCSWAQKARA